MGRWIGLSRTVGSTGSTHPTAATTAGGTARRRASRDAGESLLPPASRNAAAPHLRHQVSRRRRQEPLFRTAATTTGRCGARLQDLPPLISSSGSLGLSLPSAGNAVVFGLSLSRSTSLPHLDNAVMSQSSCVRSLRAPPKHTTKQIWRPAFKALVERAVIHLLPQLQLEQRLLREQQPAGDAGVAVKVLDAKKHKVRSFISLFQWNSRLASFLMELDSKT